MRGLTLRNPPPPPLYPLITAGTWQRSGTSPVADMASTVADMEPITQQAIMASITQQTISVTAKAAERKLNAVIARLHEQTGGTVQLNVIYEDALPPQLVGRDPPVLVRTVVPAEEARTDTIDALQTSIRGSSDAAGHWDLSDDVLEDDELLIQVNQNKVDVSVQYGVEVRQGRKSAAENASSGVQVLRTGDAVAVQDAKFRHFVPATVQNILIYLPSKKKENHAFFGESGVFMSGIPLGESVVVGVLAYSRLLGGMVGAVRRAISPPPFLPFPSTFYRKLSTFPDDGK